MTDQKSGKAVTLYPFDVLVIGYCLLMILLIACFGRPLNRYLDEIAFYCGMAALAALIIRYTDETNGRVQAFFRLLYPALMFTFFYGETGGLMFLFFDGFFDWQLATFEKIILGANPTLYIDTHLLNTTVTEVLSFCYFSYYLLLPGFLLPVFIRKDYTVLKQFLTAVCLTFFVSYLLFSLYPVEGPRWYFAEQYLNEVTGPVFRPLVEFVIDNGAVRGGAMPSSHTGVALVIMIFCLRYYRRAGRLLVPVIIGLSLGTVWGRFHYVTDVIIGALIGVFSIALVFKYYRPLPNRDIPDETQMELSTHHVS